MRRSAFYYTPIGIDAATLALMKHIDRVFPKYPVFGSRQIAADLRRDGIVAGRHRIRRLMAKMGLEAVYKGSVRPSVIWPPARFPSDRSQPAIGEKRSSNIMANWFTAVSHPRTVREVFSWPRMAR